MTNNFSSYNRINIGLALTIVFLLVFATNRIDKNHFETVQNALITLHTDRVVAQDLIYKMNTIIYKKQLQNINVKSENSNENLNTDFYSLLENFSNTKLTPIEATIFKRLQVDFDELILSEKKNLEDSSIKEAILNSLNSIKNNLMNLSEIQISESKHLTSVAQKSLDTNNLISNFEIGFLILIGLLIQFTIFYRVKKSKKNMINE